MQDAPRSPNLFTRDDTFFGICEGIGTDLGIHPNLIRVTLAGFGFFYPIPVIAIYLGMGVLVFATRWLVPDHVPATLVDVSDPATPAVDQSQGDDALPLAA